MAYTLSLTPWPQVGNLLKKHGLIGGGRGNDDADEDGDGEEDDDEGGDEVLEGVEDGDLREVWERLGSSGGADALGRVCEELAVVADLQEPPSLRAVARRLRLLGLVRGEKKKKNKVGVPHACADRCRLIPPPLCHTTNRQGGQGRQRCSSGSAAEPARGVQGPPGRAQSDHSEAARQPFRQAGDAERHHQKISSEASDLVTALPRFPRQVQKLLRKHGVVDGGAAGGKRGRKERAAEERAVLAEAMQRHAGKADFLELIAAELPGAVTIKQVGTGE